MRVMAWRSTRSRRSRTCSRAVLVLVHRPHQAGVAFLDQVEEAQPAVPVLLGDRHDERRLPPDSRAWPARTRRSHLDLDAAAERRGSRALQHVVVQPFRIGQVLALAVVRIASIAPPARPSHEFAPASSSEAGPSAWIDNSSTSVTVLRRRILSDRRAALLLLVGPRMRTIRNRLILGHEVFERLEVVRHPLKDLVLLEVQRHLDRIEGQLAGADALSVSTTWRRTPSHSRTLRRKRAPSIAGQTFLVARAAGSRPSASEHPHRIVDRR